MKKGLNRMRMSILRAVKSIPAAMEREFLLLELLIGFSRSGLSLKLNGLFLNNVARGLLEEKHYRVVDRVFQIVCGFMAP